MPKRLVIFGAGGHAKVAIDAVEREGSYRIAFLADMNPDLVGRSVLGHAVRSQRDGLQAGDENIRAALIAIGDNANRRRVADLARQAGLSLVRVIHPSAILANTVNIGEGTLVMPGSILNADARIGENAIVNTGVVVEHDCEVGNDVHLAPHATLCGGVRIGEGALVGAGATVLVGVRIGARAIIGAGSTVLEDVAEGATVAGSPARCLKRRK